MPKSQTRRKLSPAPSITEAEVVIREQEYVPRFPLAQLEEFPGNPKDHDIGAIAESMEKLGFAGAILTQRGKWTPNQKVREDGSVKYPARMVAGHGRKATLLAKGLTHVPVLLIDMPDRIAEKFLLAENRTGQLGGYDEGLLLDFLRPLALAGDLGGTGYSMEHVDDLAKLFVAGDYGTESREVNPDSLALKHTCPRCGFAFDKGSEKKAGNDSLALIPGDGDEDDGAHHSRGAAEDGEGRADAE